MVGSQAFEYSTRRNSQKKILQLTDLNKLPKAKLKPKKVEAQKVWIKEKQNKISTTPLALLYC